MNESHDSRTNPDDSGAADQAGSGGSGSALAVLRTSALRRVLAAFLLFGISEWAAWIAILVWAFEDGGASAAGLVSVVQMVPATLAAPFVASFLERMRRDHSLALGYALQAGSRLLVALALVMDAPTVVVYVLAAIATTSIVFTRPMHHAVIPEIARTPGEITVGHSASGTIEGLSLFVGPLLAGLMLHFYGPASIFYLTSAAAFISIFLTMSLPLRRTLVRDIRAETVIRATVTGFHELRHNAGALLLTLIVAAQWIVIGALDVLTVVFGIDILDMGEEGPGILMSAVGVGGLIGAAATVVLVGRRKLSPAIGGGVLLAGLSLVAVSFSLLPVVACLLLAISGFGKAFVDVAGRTLLHRVVRPEVLSRVFGVQESMIMGGVAVGAIITPLMINTFGARESFVVTGLFLPVVGLLALIQIRKLDAEALLPGPGFDRLEAIPMFAALSQATLEQLSRELTSIAVPAGTDIFQQGDAGDLLYIVDEGNVSIIRNGTEINVMHPGEFFGEIALLRDIPRTATARANEDVKLYALARDVFLTAVTGSSTSHELAHAEADRRREGDEPD